MDTMKKLYIIKLSTKYVVEKGNLRLSFQLDRFWVQGRITNVHSSIHSRSVVEYPARFHKSEKN
jgi:hypothetical protein